MEVTVGIRALKQNASAVVASAVSGDVVTITERGRPVAHLTALPTSPVERLVEAGRVRPPSREIRDLPPAAPGPTLSDVLTAMRDDERY